MNNKISEYSQLEPLKKIEKLVQLDLSECPIAEKEDYRKKVFEMFNQLEILDNKDADGASIDYGDIDGEGEGDFEGEFEGDVEGEEEFYDDGDEEDYQDDDDDESEERAKPSKKLKK